LLNDPVEPSARRATAKKLCDQMLYGFQGCSLEQHERQLEVHTEAAGNNHFALDQIFNEPSFPPVLGLPYMVSKDDLYNSQTSNGSQWNAMFCGVSDSDSQSTSPVKNVCLHKEQTQQTNPDVSFDIDSFLGFAASLGVARNGLLYQPSPQAQQNLSSDVHFGLDISDTSSSSGRPTRPSFAMLPDVPHFFLGRIVGAENVTITLSSRYHLDIVDRECMGIILRTKLLIRIDQHFLNGQAQGMPSLLDKDTIERLDGGFLGHDCRCTLCHAYSPHGPM